VARIERGPVSRGGDTTTTTGYAPLTGRVTSVTTTNPGGATVQEQAFEYDLDGRVERVTTGGEVLADPVYADGRLVTVDYPASGAGNGSALTGIERDPNGATGEDAYQIFAPAHEGYVDGAGALELHRAVSRGRDGLRQDLGEGPGGPRSFVDHPRHDAGARDECDGLLDLRQLARGPQRVGVE
jgi:hypothetical protein